MNVLWRVRADSAPVIAEICHELPRGELPLPIHAEDSAATDSAGKELVRCSWSEMDIKFVSSEYLAIGERSGQTEECEPRGGRWYQSYYVSRFNGDSSLALSRFTAARIDSVARLALARSAKDLAKDELCTNVVEGFNPYELVEIGNQWYPSRVEGRWRPVLIEELGTGDCQLLPVVDVPLASALTGHDSLRLSWAVLTKQVKGLQDAFASPRGDWFRCGRQTRSTFTSLLAGASAGELPRFRIGPARNRHASVGDRPQCCPLERGDRRP